MKRHTVPVLAMGMRYFVYNDLLTKFKVKWHILWHFEIIALYIECTTLSTSYGLYLFNSKIFVNNSAPTHKCMLCQIHLWFDNVCVLLKGKKKTLRCGDRLCKYMIFIGPKGFRFGSFSQFRFGWMISA